MKLIFGALAIFAVVMVLISGSVGGWITSSSLKEAKRDSVKTLAMGLAYSVSSEIQMFERTVTEIAKNEDVIAALESNDPAVIEKTADKVQKFLPNALKVRLLPTTVNATDERQEPIMGYADLEMVKKTITSKQPFAIQGEGTNRHLAITSAIKKDNQVIGVVLASLSVDFITETIKKSPVEDNLVEITQDSVILGSAGDSALPRDNQGQLDIANTPWKISYVPATVHTMSSLGIVTGLVIVLAILTLIALFLGYYYMANLLKKDQNKVLEAVKNLMTGKGLGVYELHLSEMQVIISTLVQFKRILDNKNSKTKPPKDIAAKDMATNDSDNFLDELDAVEIKKSDSGLLKKKTEGKPIAEAKPKLKPKHEVTEPPPPPPKPEPKLGQKPEPKPYVEKAPPIKLDLFSSLSKPEPSKAKQEVRVDDIFKAYDIRGIVGKDLTKEIIHDIGLALGSEAKSKGVKTVVVARDGRLSGPELSESLVKGIISTGCQVLDIGMVPTPVLYFVTHHTDGRTGVMVTGSHNPPDYNGLKMVMRGETLADERIQQLKQRIANKDFESGTDGAVERSDSYSEEYIGTICDDVHLDKTLKVVVDCGNGVAGKMAPELLTALGCEVIELFCEIDGKFPNHHPDPSKPENLKDLIAAVASHQADVGLAFDGDGDRLGVVDNTGKIIWADRQMMLYAKQVLSIKSGAEIIYDVKCSRHLGEQIRKHGGRPTMWKTGHSLMKAKLKETGAALAGEMSGHIFFNDRWFGFDDALYTAARLLQILAADNRSSSEIFASFPDSINTPELNVALNEGEKFAFMAELAQKVNFPDAKIIDIDGLRVEFKDGWGLVRASNTTPSLVVRFEADNAEALDRIQQQIKKLMVEVKNDIRLPF